MKIIRVLFVVMMVIVAFGQVKPASAGAFTYTSGIVVQNLENATANITLTFYFQSGAIAASVPYTINALDNRVFFPLTDVGSGFNGSVIISSDRRVAAISNVHGSGATDAAASYTAASSGSTKVLVPMLHKNNGTPPYQFNSWFNVQNVGSVAANVSVTYSDGTSASGTIQPGASKTFDQTAETHTLKAFSAEVTSTNNQPLAVTGIQETQGQMYAYSGFAAGSTSPVLPLINIHNPNYNSILTGIQIQNSGTLSTNVTLSYTPEPGAGTACTETQTIPAGASRTFAFLAFNGGGVPYSNCIPNVKFVGVAKVTTNSASQPLEVIVNQFAPSTGSSYDGFDPSAATSKVVFPLVRDRDGPPIYWWTGFTIQNVGTTTTTVTCTFTGSSRTVVRTLNPGQVFVDLQGGNFTVGYVGAATCVASDNGKISGIMNQVGSGTGDLFMTYEGVNTQ